MLQTPPVEPKMASVGLELEKFIVDILDGRSRLIIDNVFDSACWKVTILFFNIWIGVFPLGVLEY